MRAENTQPDNNIVQAYTKKPISYFDTPRQDYIDYLPDNPGARILELGTGSGPTGEACLKLGKCSEYVGIELNPEMAAAAADKITEVIEGDIEEINIPYPDEYFDILIMSEVLEHLRDPDLTVSKLLDKVKKGGLVMASSPNISHHRIIRYLIKGDWPLTDEGVMDRTHLRWFTPKTFQKMFEEAGCQTTSIGPVSRKKLKYKIINFISSGKWNHLITTQINYYGRKL